MHQATGWNPNSTKATFCRRLFLILVLAVLPVAYCHAEAMKFELLATSDIPLDNPHDVKLSPDGRRLFVSDVGNDRVVILDAADLTLLGTFGADEQDGTHDVDFDAAGGLLVADTHNNRILRYRLEAGRWQLVGELRGEFRGPEGVLAHPNGRIYVAGAWSGDVIAYDQGKAVARLAGLSAPHDLELAPDDGIWLADAGNDRMLLLSPDLEIRRELKGVPYHFNGVRYQDVMPDGTLIAADKNNNSVKIIAPDGQLLAVLDGRALGTGAGPFRTPEGIEYLDGILWISDSGNNRILKFRVHR